MSNQSADPSDNFAADPDQPSELVYQSLYMPEPTLGDVVKSIWDSRYSLFLFGVAGLVLGLFYVTLAVPQYKASLLIAPAERTQSADLKTLFPQTQSFAIQKLVNSIASQDQTDFVRLYHIIHGPAVAAILLDDQDMLRPVLDDRAFSFQDNDDVLNNAARFSAYLEDQVKVYSVGNTNLKRIEYHHPDAEFAAFFLHRLYHAADQIIRDDSRKATDQRIAYLNESLQSISNPDHRRAMASLLVEQEHARMLLSMDAPYAATIAEPAVPPAKPDYPRPILIYTVFLAVFLFLGYSFSSVLRSTQKIKS